jgi:predicted RecA/RadA family phage recombinase
MAQTPALRDSEGDAIDYTPGSAVTAGDVVLVGTIPMIAISDIEANVQGSLATSGVWKVPMASGALSAGDAVYWDADGSPNSGTASSGAATGTATGNNLMGAAMYAAGASDTYVYVLLTAAKRTATIAGSVTADDITGSDATLAIAGLAAAQGGLVSMTGGTSSTGGNAGGAVSLVGGTPGATGVGGAASVAGGAGGSTSGTGGAVAIAGGAGTAGNANGGAVSVLGGNAHGSGTDGVLSLGTSNTSAINIGAAGILTRNAGHFQAGGNAAVTATTGGGTTGLIPAGASFVTVTSDNADKQISLPAGTIGDVIRILVGGTACELIAVTAADKVNEVTVGATNELALTADALYTCTYTKENYWIVTGETKLGARISALVPDALA